MGWLRDALLCGVSGASVAAVTYLLMGLLKKHGITGLLAVTICGFVGAFSSYAIGKMLLPSTRGGKR